ncbi:MAG: response regulator [Terriglobales bacterium]
MKILVADDNANCRYMMLETLAPVGAELFSAAKGVEAWERLQEKDPPHMVILSATLPEFDGLEVCQKIRLAKSPNYTYVILLSGQKDKTDMLNAFEAGVDDYVTRPVSPAEILARVQVGQRSLEKENRLSLINHQWRTMIDNLPFGLACLGREGEIRRVNKVFAEQLGLDLRCLIGKSLRPAILPRIEDHRLLLDHMRGARDFDGLEMQMMHHDGRLRRVIVWGRPIDRTGELTFQIITSVKQ